MRTIELSFSGILHGVRLAAAFVLLGLALSSLSAAGAQGSSGDDDPQPLLPADISSPRDTLQSFLGNASAVIEAWRSGDISARSARDFVRAVETLDLSTTPHSDAWGVRTERLLLLKEILDRIELPPAGTIPGDSEVADGKITQWKVPGTVITIARIAEGPRAGKFLFSADTVQRLHRHYVNARHLPYRPGAPAGAYEAWVRSDATVPARQQQVRNRLKPVDTSNPRSTLSGFLDSINRAYAMVIEADVALQAEPPGITREEAGEIALAARNLLQRAVRTLDLSEVPAALREDVGVEAALQLKEVFDRMKLPPVDTVPDDQMVAAVRRQSGGTVRWRYPNTEIEIAEVTQGERRGQFLFSAATVRRIGDYYRQIRELPYRGGLQHIDWLASDTSDGFYEYFVSTPGYMVPRAHFLGRFVEQLPAGLKTVYHGETLWQWLGLLLSVLALALAAWLIYRTLRRTAKRLATPLDEWLMILVPVTVAILVRIVVEFVDNDINITGHPHVVVVTAGSVIVIAMAAWAVFLLCRAAAETLIARPHMQAQSSEAALLRIGARVLGYLLVAWIVIDGLRALGADLIPLLAGLGVGGLALALAAQSTIANFIGGLILFVNKPVRVGEFCRYGEDPNPGWLRIGSVEEIGWISTRIRGIDRTITTIPNAEFSKMHIVNLTVRDRRLLRTTLRLRYETTPEQMRHVLTRLRELLLGHPMVTPDPARVRYTGYSDYSKDVAIFAYFHCQDENTFLAIQEDLLLRMEEIIAEAGTGFAFPSQTAYLARDAGLDAERREEAEARVGHLRARGKLPFPEFEEEERKRLEDILDYPPKGSPGYQPRSD